MKIEFLMCGSPNDAFYSQAAMYRYVLDSFGGIYKQARVVLCLGDFEESPLPARWEPWFTNIDVRWTPLESFLCYHNGSDYILKNLVDPAAEISFLCDADTLLLHPLPDSFLREMQERPAICGAIAHYRPSPDDQAGHDYSALDNDQFWEAMGMHVSGRAIPLPNTYTLMPGDLSCPFYINYGFVAGTPTLLRRLHTELAYVQPKLREILDNDFYAQIALALAVDRASLPTRVLPMRFNFPNDPIADAKYPDELANVHVIHYLRTNVFDRHRIFTTREEFESFLALPLQGSNAVFQRRIREFTAGQYPFG